MVFNEFIAFAGHDSGVSRGGLVALQSHDDEVLMWWDMEIWVDQRALWFGVYY